MKFNDAISGAVLLALALAVLLTIRGYPVIPGQNVGPAAFPGVVASLLLVCAVGLIVRGLRTRRSEPGARWFVAGAWLRSPRQLRSFAVTVGALLFYIGVSERLGFIPTAFLVLVAMFLSLGVRRGLIVPVALTVVLVIHTIFYKGLRVPLPWGILSPVMW